MTRRRVIIAGLALAGHARTGAIAAKALAATEPDGYTIMLGTRARSP